MRILTLLQRYMSSTGSVAFWHTHLALLPAPRWDQQRYPIDFRSKVAYGGPFDEAGIPLLDYKGETGVQYNPTAVAQYGIGCLQTHQDAGDAARLAQAILCADWLCDWVEERPDGTAWLPYTFPIAEVGLTAPFYSGLAQAIAYSFLVRMYQATQNSVYQTIATKLLPPMLLPVEEGGLARTIDQSWIIEEFVLDRPSVVLDGWLFAIMALIDASLHEKDGPFSDHKDSAIASLKALLPKFELGYWSRTDLYSDNPKMPSSPFYHNLHVLQLTCIAEYCGDAELAAVATRWANYIKNPVTRYRALALKIYLKLARY